MEELEQAIAENARGPSRVAGDSATVEQHRITDQIAADRYLASKKAAKSRTRGLRFSKIVPPGAD